MLVQTWSSLLPPPPDSRRCCSRKAFHSQRSHRRVTVSKVSRFCCSMMFSIAEFPDIIQNKVLLAATISAAIGQFSKPFTSSIFRRTGLDFRKAVQAGGFPSTHSSAAVAAATTLGFERGFSDSIYGLAVVYACLTMYDAQGVRREVGIHAKCLNKVLNEKTIKPIVSISDSNDSTDSISNISSNFGSFESPQGTETITDSRTSAERELELNSFDYFPLKESVGHTVTEVIAGALLGFLVSLTLCVL